VVLLTDRTEIARVETGGKIPFAEPSAGAYMDGMILVWAFFSWFVLLDLDKIQTNLGAIARNTSPPSAPPEAVAPAGATSMPVPWLKGVKPWRPSWAFHAGRWLRTKVSG